jgi:Bacteriorhodopsin-like protein
MRELGRIAAEIKLRGCFAAAAYLSRRRRCWSSLANFRSTSPLLQPPPLTSHPKIKTSQCITTAIRPWRTIVSSPPAFYRLLTRPAPSAQIHLTTHGSDWLWAVFSIFALFTALFLVWTLLRPATHRVFPYFATAIALTTAVTYFTLASDLGSEPVGVEFQRGGKVYGGTRQVFWVRYVNW